MEKEKIDLFMMQNHNNLPMERSSDIRRKLEEMSDDKCYVLQSQMRDFTTILLLSIFVGELGVDRFMLGDTGLGILKLLTCGGCGIWWLIDLINCKKMTQKYNYELFLRLC